MHHLCRCMYTCLITWYLDTVFVLSWLCPPLQPSSQVIIGSSGAGAWGGSNCAYDGTPVVPTTDVLSTAYSLAGYSVAPVRVSSPTAQGESLAPFSVCMLECMCACGHRYIHTCIHHAGVSPLQSGSQELRVPWNT